MANWLPTTATAPFCPSEIQQTVRVPRGAGGWKRFWAYSGVGLLVSVGYMDPGNWATDIEAGSRFGYGLLCVVLLASMIATLLQSLCVRLGIASGRDLAQLCREQFRSEVNLFLGLFAEIAIIACDFAEVLGTALALQLLFSLPLGIGILLTAFDTVIVLVLQGKGIMRVESIVLGLVATITLAFMMEIILSKPDWVDVAAGLWPHLAVLKNPESWMIAIGIFGATVMPHNLYLHSSAVGTRTIEPGDKGKDDAIRLMTYDTVLTLGLAFFVNAAILVLAGNSFHLRGHSDVKEIGDAYHLLAPLLGTSLASIVFALALFASGQSSTLTGTIAGQVILDGFLNIKIPCWQRRFITRGLAIIPAWLGIFFWGEHALGRMLVWSQVVLSMQLPFAIAPLVLFCSRKALMGKWALPYGVQALCWAICLGITAANLFLITQL